MIYTNYQDLEEPLPRGWEERMVKDNCFYLVG